MFFRKVKRKGTEAQRHEGTKAAPGSSVEGRGDLKTVVLVGHCGPDAWMLSSAVERMVPGAKVEQVHDDGALEGYLNGESVLLVNRVLDGRFFTGSGIELIGKVAGGAGGEDGTVLILISNFAESQEEAVAAGAGVGFGKNDLYEERTGEILREAAGG